MKKPAKDISLDTLLGQVADEFTERLSRGEQPDIEEYARRYPQITQVIRETFPALQMVTPSRLDDTAGVGSSDRRDGAARRLGDYRILREIGRGGMGVVYEAEQVSLGRRVALKVLPFAAVLDQRQLQRFKNEAQAAAQLHHTNIVPVFSVGCERGVHYYAMQYIEGRTLASVIGELSHLSGSEAIEPDQLPRVTSEQTRSLTTGHWAPPKKNDSDGDSAVAAPVPTAEGSSAAVQVLARIGTRLSPETRHAVAAVLAQRIEDLSRPCDRERMVTALGSMEDAATDHLLWIGADATLCGLIRSALPHALASTGDARAMPLLLSLHDGAVSDGERIASVLALGHLVRRIGDDGQPVDPAIPLIRMDFEGHSSPAVAVAAALALARAGHLSAPADATRVFQLADDPAARKNALRVVLESQMPLDSEQRQAIEAYAQDEGSSPAVRKIALVLLAE